MIPLAKSDLKTLQVLVAGGRRLDSAPPFFVDAVCGILHTTIGDYEFSIGEEKLGTQSHRLSCFPMGPPGGRAELHVRWDKQAGERLQQELRKAIEQNGAAATRKGYEARRP
jgi:hypothetical protein